MVGYNILRISRRTKLQNKRKLVYIILIFVSLITISGIHSRFDSVSAISPVSTANNLELIIDYGNSTRASYSGLSAETVFDVLNEMANITYTEFVYGKFVISVNDVGNNAGGNGFYWQYWVNDELGPVAADKFSLEDGDCILWKYCAPSYTPSGSTQSENNLILGFTIILVAGSVVISVAFLLNRKMR